MEKCEENSGHGELRKREKDQGECERSPDIQGQEKKKKKKQIFTNEAI